MKTSQQFIIWLLIVVAVTIIIAGAAELAPKPSPEPSGSPTPPASFPVTVRVEDANTPGWGIAGINVIIGAIPAGQTNGEGNLNADLAPGSYTVQAYGGEWYTDESTQITVSPTQQGTLTVLLQRLPQ